MSQPVFDPLDAAVLTKGLVPWGSGIIAEEAAAQRQEMMQCTSDADAWNWAQVADPQELTRLAHEARRQYIQTLVHDLVGKVRAALHRPVAAGLAHGEHA